MCSCAGPVFNLLKVVRSVQKNDIYFFPEPIGLCSSIFANTLSRLLEMENGPMLCKICFTLLKNEDEVHKYLIILNWLHWMNGWIQCSKKETFCPETGQNWFLSTPVLMHGGLICITYIRIQWCKQYCPPPLIGKKFRTCFGAWKSLFVSPVNENLPGLCLCIKIPLMTLLSM